MERKRLCDCFLGVAAKRLVAADLQSKASDQYEIEIPREVGVWVASATSEARIEVDYRWLGPEDRAWDIRGSVTFPNVRVQTTGQEEYWWLRQHKNEVIEEMAEGDSLFLAVGLSGKLSFVVAPWWTSAPMQMSWLLNLEPRENAFITRKFGNDEPELDFASRFLLREIGVECHDADASEFNSVFNRHFTLPSARALAWKARDSLPHIRPEDGADDALVKWLSREQAMFRRLERLEISTEFMEEFVDEGDVDFASSADFAINFFDGIQGRRRARAEESLHSHLETIFRTFGVSFVRGVVADLYFEPDFLFPALEAYRAAPATGASNLAMLGAEPKCSDGWSEVLMEANKIPKKHLLTLEPALSEVITDDMKDKNLQLVVPKCIQRSYTLEQQSWLWSVDDFVRDVSDRCRV